jgi:hypothetical protein
MIQPIECEGCRLGRGRVPGMMIEVGDVLPAAQEIIHRSRRIDLVPAFLLVVLVPANEEKRPGGDECDQFVLIGACRRGPDFVA